MKKNKESRIDLRFALIGPGTMWNLLYEGMDQRVNLRSTFRGKDEESVNALIKFGEILKKKNDYDINIKEDGIEINNIIPINDFENGEKYYLQGLAIDPNHKGINEYLGELYVATNRHNLAVERLEVLKNCNCEEYEELKAVIAGEKVSKY